MKLRFLFCKKKKIKSNGQKSVRRANFGFCPTFFLDLKNFERWVNSRPEEIKKPEKFLFHFQLTSRKEDCLVSGLFPIHFPNSCLLVYFEIFSLLDFFSL